MKKIIFISFLIYFNLNSYALAFNCDLSKFQIGKNISNFEDERKVFMYGEILNNIGAISIPIEYPCEKTEANGTFITLFFIDDKIVRIIFENQIMRNRILFKIANKIYNAGFEKNEKIINSNQPEQYAIEKNGTYFLYANIEGINENKGNFFELFEIVDSKYEDAAKKELLKIENR